jgi:hypothetical protein
VERVTGIEPAWPAWKAGSVNSTLLVSCPFAPWRSALDAPALSRPTAATQRVPDRRWVTRGRVKHGDHGAGNLGVADVGSLLVQKRGDGGGADKGRGEPVALAPCRSVTTSPATSHARRVTTMILILQ